MLYTLSDAVGHEITNHSYSHNNMPSMSYENIIPDIQKCKDLIKDITGESHTMFRAPSGSYDNKTISVAETPDIYTFSGMWRQKRSKTALYRDL